MIRRKKHLDKSIIRYELWKPEKLKKKLYRSFLTNLNLKPLNRLSLIVQDKYTNNHHKFYMSQNKLQCLFSYSFSVPSRLTRTSRFFINKGVERLMFGGYQK